MKSKIATWFVPTIAERDERITWEHCVQELQQYLE
jgi:hypothetical protein